MSRSLPAEEQQALATMIKQRRDSIDQFTKGNRPELAAAEAAEIVVIEEFLPKALDEAALAALVAEAVAEVAAAAGKAPTPKEMGSGDEGCPGQAASQEPARRRPHRERSGEEGAGL